MQNVLLLHGAIGAADQMQPLADALGGEREIHVLNFSGHGGEAFPSGPFSIPLFANEVLNYIEERKLEEVSVFGYSMGGYVAMHLAKKRPGLLHKLITLATKFEWSEAIAAKEVQMLNAEKIEAKVPAFATALKERHAPNDWKQVLSRTAEMLEALGRDSTLKSEDYSTISTPTLLLLGDRDKMISLEETVAVYRALPNAQMGMLPDTAHPIEQVDVGMLVYLANRFL